MKSKRTLGKWRAVITRLNSKRWLVLAPKAGLSVCDCMDVDRSEANAKFIARAPEMHDLLCKFVKFYNKQKDMKELISETQKLLLAINRIDGEEEAEDES